MRCSMGGNGKPPKGWSPPLLLSELFEGKSCGKTQRARGILAIELETTPPRFRLLALGEVSENDGRVSESALGDMLEASRGAAATARGGHHRRTTRRRRAQARGCPAGTRGPRRSAPAAPASQR